MTRTPEPAELFPWQATPHLPHCARAFPRKPLTPPRARTHRRHFLAARPPQKWATLWAPSGQAAFCLLGRASRVFVFLWFLFALLAVLGVGEGPHAEGWLSLVGDSIPGSIMRGGICAEKGALFSPSSASSEEPRWSLPGRLAREDHSLPDPVTPDAPVTQGPHRISML